MPYKSKPFNYSRRKLVTCRMNDPLTLLARILVDNKAGSALVKDAKGEYSGMITDTMIFKAIASGVNVTMLKVGDLKMEPLVKVSKNADLGEVTELFKKSVTDRLAMVDSKGHIVGVLKKNVLERFKRFQVGSQMTMRE